jgi:hypothetical protein
MNIILLIKRLAALLLAVCFFLPLSQCEPKLDAPSQAVQSHAAPQTPHVSYAYEAYVWPSMGSVITFALFFWPATLQAALLRKKDLRRPRLLAAGPRWACCSCAVKAGLPR